MFCNGIKCGFFVNHFKTKDMRRETKLQQLSLPPSPPQCFFPTHKKPNHTGASHLNSRYGCGGLSFFFFLTRIGYFYTYNSEGTLVPLNYLALFVCIISH